MNEDLRYKIGVSLLPGLGDIVAKSAIAYCGSAEAVFGEKKQNLEKIPGIGTLRASEIIDNREDALLLAEEEIKFIRKNSITPLFYLDKEYPARLKNCEDAPVMLYCKGEMDLNTKRIVSIVGTRMATDYGKTFCEKLVEDLKDWNATIVSGLAYGIDTCAHRAAVKQEMQTVGVLAHGLDELYPAANAPLVKKMLPNGGIITEFPSGTKMAPELFPRRNRIVAGLADAVVVIESKLGGGSLITADQANGYNRDVFALPGRIGDGYSEGCNRLIKINKAALLESAKDMAYLLGWEERKGKKKIQRELFVQLTSEEQTLIGVLKEKGKLHVDELSVFAEYPMSKTSSLLFTLEMNGVVKSLPGKMYELG
jgi:DNA processing protein